MPAFTGQELVDRAAAQADMHDNFVSPATWLAWLNYELQALYIFMARAGWTLQAETSEAISASQGASVTGYNTTGDVLAVLGVYEVTQGKFRRLAYRPRIDGIIDASTPTGTPVTYTAKLNGDGLTIHMYPPPASGTYQVVYLPNPSKLTDLADAFSIALPLGFEELPVLKMARRALLKEESDTRPTEMLAREVEQTIEEACWSRMLADAPVIRNVDREHRGWSSYPDFGLAEGWAWL